MREENSQKDEFLGMISHELRTPLNAVFGWTKLMQENLLSEEERGEAVKSIMRNAEAQARLIEDVLDITRIINHKLSLDREVINPLHIVAEAVEAVRPSADAKGILLESASEAEDLLVDADPNRLQQVLLNLLTNAVKFTRRGGKVRVRTARERAGAAIEILDTGQGISAELLPHIFERFRQGDSSSTRHHRGLGLGLTIAHQLVVMHGGDDRCPERRRRPREPLHGAPADCRARHPRTARRLARPQRLKMFSPPTVSASVHVMVIDDEPSVRDLVALTLAKCGASVTVAASVKDALSLMPNLKPDVVVSDIAMPEVDGYQFIRRLRELAEPRGADIPAIALTAYAGAQDRRRALESRFRPAPDQAGGSGGTRARDRKEPGREGRTIRADGCVRALPALARLANKIGKTAARP